MWIFHSDIIRWALEIGFGIVLVVVLRRRGAFGSRANEELSLQIKGQMEQWEASTQELVEYAKGLMEELRELASMLERADIRACETLRRLQGLHHRWRPMSDRYLKAIGWLREGMALEEVSRRTSIGIDELRFIEGLSKRRNEAAG